MKWYFKCPLAGFLIAMGFGLGVLVIEWCRP